MMPTESDEATDRVAALERRVALLEQELEQAREQLKRERGQRRESLADKLRPKLWRFHHYPPRPLRFPDSYKQQSLPAAAPSIAIVTPSFNQDEFIAATIDSVLNQNYPNLRYHVQDGGSRDGTLAILKSYNGRFSWSSEIDRGQANALNIGFNSLQADHDVMAYLNSDDLLAPGTLAYVAKAFIDNPQIDVVYGHRICIDAQGMEIGRWVLPRHDRKTIKWFDFVPQETMFWRRRVWQALGGFDEAFQYAIDWDFILRGHAKGMVFARLPRFLACFRVHDGQKTTRILAVGNAESQQLRKIHLGYEPDAAAVTRAGAAYLRRHVFYHRLYKLKVLNY